MSILFFHLLTGLAYGMFYFMIAASLTIILGVMNIVNLAHGALFLIGGYLTFSLVSDEYNFWISLLITVIVMIVLGILIERFLIKYVYGKELEQVLLTFGLSFILADSVKWIWGSQSKALSAPELLNFSISFGDGLMFPFYRLFIVFVGLLLAAFLYYFEKHTRIGSIIRAGVDDREMVSALGINVGLIFTGVFAFGAGIAGLSGGLGAPLLGVYSGMDADILVISLIIVVVGGLGSWQGSLIGAILIGVIETLSKAWIPTLSMLIIFIIMIVVLLVRPRGLFGKEVEM